jgi:hypothetical protein
MILNVPVIGGIRFPAPKGGVESLSHRVHQSNFLGAIFIVFEGYFLPSLFEIVV